MGRYKVLIINTGSTSTKIAVYDDSERTVYKNITHTVGELSRFETIPAQLEFRKQAVLDELAAKKIALSDLSAVCCLTTGLLPMNGGVYEVNELMAEHGRLGIGSRHPGNLGPMITYEFEKQLGIPGYTVDTSSVDEFCMEARVTGWKEIVRVSRGHPLNQRAAGRRFAEDHGKNYEDLNLIVAHIGGGISVTAHEKGRMIDTVDSTNGEGRMAPTRTGALPAAFLVDKCFSGEYTRDELRKKISSTGGWTDHLGTSDAREVVALIKKGDKYAELICNATIYQLGKDIGAMASVLSGDVDAVILTGGIAYSEYITKRLIERIKFIAPVYIYPGEFEMEALALNAMRALEGKTGVQEYTGKPVFEGFPKN